MGKKILVVNGSPRRGSNTDALVESFKKGCEKSENSVKVFVPSSDPVQGCRGCDRCWSKGEACIFDDGLRRLSPMFEWADMLMLATPLYYFGFSSQLKAVIDKMYPYISPLRKAEMKIAESVLLVCEGAEETKDCEGLLATYNTMCTHLGWMNRGVVIANGVLGKGEIQGHAALCDAEKIGGKL